jgi:DNA-binding CsgD family transcriptional regulator/PAS domain-containing protein
MINQSDLASVIATIYEAGVDFDRWPQALARVTEALGGASASLVRQGATHEDCWGFGHRVEEGWDQRYFEHFHSVNPLWGRTWLAPAGSVHTDTMVVPRDDLARTEFFQDFLTPQGVGGMLNAVVLMEAGRQTILTVHSGREIEEAQLALYRLMTPHLQRAMELNVQLARSEISRAGAEAVVDRLDQGVLFVDAGARVIFANRSAEAMLAAGMGLRQSDGVLHGATLSETAALHAAIGICAGAAPAAAPPSFVPLSRGDGRRPLSVRVAPASPGVFPPWLGGWRPIAMLCITDPELNPTPAADELRMRYGLTRAQAALAVEILAGDGVQAAADRLSITRATARTHLAQIFEKTGTQRQSELVRLLMNSGLCVRSN